LIVLEIIQTQRPSLASENCIFYNIFVIAHSHVIDAIEEAKMGRRFVVNALVTVLYLMVAACATLETAEHKYIMRGQVLEVTGNEAYLCIGSKDGAQVGQEYTVYRFVKVPNPNTKSPVPYFRREEIGKLKIMEIVDEHMATAKTITGKIQANDVVELNP
jgi:hypothetical protein